MPAPRFVLSRSTDNQHYFNLVAGNSEKILTSELYRSRTSALAGVESVKASALIDERYDRLPSGAGHYFRLRGANGEIVGVSEVYSSRAARENGIGAVKRAVVGAEVVDQAE